MPGLLAALRDPQFRRDVMNGLTDAANRGGVAGVLGGPVDLATMAMRPFGYSVEKPVGGSEWVGQKMQDAGFVSPNRNALAEALASVAVPGAMAKAGPALYAAEQNAMMNAMAPGPRSGSAAAQLGMIRIPGRGQIPETHADVKKLSDRFGRLLDDAGVSYSADKSQISPARYFTFDNPASVDPVYGIESYKVRISDHRNVHGADFSVDPSTGKTFEEMMSEVRGLGVPIADRVRPLPVIVKQRAALVDDLVMGRTAQRFGGTDTEQAAWQGLVKQAESAATKADIEKVRKAADALSQSSRAAFTEAHGFDPGHVSQARLFLSLKNGETTLEKAAKRGYSPDILSALAARL